MINPARHINPKTAQKTPALETAQKAAMHEFARLLAKNAARVDFEAQGEHKGRVRIRGK